MAAYPGAQPDIDNMGPHLASNPHTALHDEVRDELQAVTTELGVDPAGSFGTVVERLDDGLLGRSHFRQLSTQAILQNQNDDITFDEELRDDDGWADLDANDSRMLAPIDGLVSVGFSCICFQATGTFPAVRIYFAGEYIDLGREVATAANTYVLTASTTLAVSDGVHDFEVNVLANGGNAAQISNANLWIARLA